MRLLHQCFLGLGKEKSVLRIDPVIPAALDGLQVEGELAGRHLAGASNHYTALGATIFFWARLAHALLYITGIWQPRAIAYFAGVAGEILIVAQLIRT